MPKIIVGNIMYMTTSDIALILFFRSRRRRGDFAALRSVVDVPTWAIATLHGSRRVRAYAFAVAAAVVTQALVHVFAALRSVVGIPSWAIAACHGSHRVRACAFAVTAAVVGFTLVNVFAPLPL